LSEFFESSEIAQEFLAIFWTVDLWQVFRWSMRLAVGWGTTVPLPVVLVEAFAAMFATEILQFSFILFGA